MPRFHCLRLRTPVQSTLAGHHSTHNYSTITMGDDFQDDFDDTEVLALPNPDNSGPSIAVVPALSKSKRKREAEKARKAKRRKDSQEDDDDSHLVFEEGKGGVNTSISKLDPQLSADYVAQKVKRFEKDLSAVELEDRYIPGEPN